MKFQNMGTMQWAVILLLGLLLAVAALPVSRKEEKEVQEEASQQAESTALENKLTALLSGTEGVGEVRVMVMTDGEKDAGGFYSCAGPKVTGVLIAAEGADRPVVVREIQEAVQALFQVEAHKIKVMKLK